MLYLVSDPHGDLCRFMNLLKHIDFKRNEKMVLLGDVLDRGPDPIGLLKYIRPMIQDGSITMLLGNHELFCIQFLEGRLSSQKWIAFGGKTTYEQVTAMPETEKDDLLSFLKSLPISYKGTSPIFGDFVATHSGILERYLVQKEGTEVYDAEASILKAYEKAPYELLCGCDLHYLPKDAFFDKYIIVGHVPFNSLVESENDQFYKNEVYMDIDAGCGKGSERLGCYVVETGEEIFV